MSHLFCLRAGFHCYQNVRIEITFTSLSKQLEACRNLISTLEANYSDSDFPCLMKASLLHREKHSDKAVELLKVQ